ncbi:MAG: hypothetical protein ACYC6F_13105 [Longimicrobiales bacterium]
MRSAVVSPLCAGTALLSLVLLGSCAGDGPGDVFIQDFVDRSPELACSVAEMAAFPASVVRLKLVGDTLLAVLADGDREILLLDHDLTVRERVRWEEEGPSALADPVDVELVGDTLLVVAERGRARLTFLDLHGVQRGHLALGFVPNRLLRDGDGWLVSALPLSPTQGEILYRVGGTHPEPLGIAPVHEATPQIKALANATVMVRAGTGRVVVAHQYVRALAHLVEFPPEGRGRAAVRDVAVPLPEGVAGTVAFRPGPPFVDEEMRRLLAPVLEAAPDPPGGGMLYLTRTGRMSGDAWEKALVRVDADMNYLASWIFPVNVGPFAWLPERGEVVAVAEDERWYRCPIPAGGGT